MTGDLEYRYLDGQRHSFDDGSTLPIDLATNAESLGVRVLRVEPGEGVIDRLQRCVAEAKAVPEGSGPVLVHVESDPLIDAPSSESWWDVPVSQVSALDSTREAYAKYAEWKKIQRPLVRPSDS